MVGCGYALRSSSHLLAGLDIAGFQFPVFPAQSGDGQSDSFHNQQVICFARTMWSTHGSSKSSESSLGTSSKEGLLFASY